MLIESWLLMEQTTHRTDQAQLTAPTAARHRTSQQGPRLLVPPQQQPGRQTCHDQQCHGK